MYVLIRKYVGVHINFKKPIYDLEKYVHMVWKIWYLIHMYIVHMIWKIRRVDGDEWQWMKRVRWMKLDERTLTDVGQKLRNIEWQRTATTIDNDYDGWQLQWWWHYKVIYICGLCNDGVQKRKEKFFSSTSFFKKKLSSSLLQRIL